MAVERVGLTGFGPSEIILTELDWGEETGGGTGTTG